LYRLSNAQNNPALQATALNQTQQFPPVPPPVNVPAAAATFASQTQASNNGVQNFASNQTNPFAAIPPVVPPTSLDPAVQQQLMLIKTLADAGIPHDQIAGVISRLGSQGTPMNGAGGALPPPPFPATNQNQGAQNGQNGWGARPADQSRDNNGFHEGMRSPGRNRRRSRSQSPARGWNARDSPASRRREEPNYDYDRDSPGRNRDDRGRPARGGRGNDYRQRSPPRRGHSLTPPRSYGNSEKWVSYDASIGKGNIKGDLETFRVGILF